LTVALTDQMLRFRLIVRLRAIALCRSGSWTPGYDVANGTAYFYKCVQIVSLSFHQPKNINLIVAPWVRPIIFRHRTEHGSSLSSSGLNSA